MDHLELVVGQADSLDLEPRESGRDRDDARRPARDRTLDEAKCTGTKRIVVVLGRDEAPRSQCPIDICVHEVRVHEIGRSRSAAHAQGEARVEIARRGDPFERDAQSLVEGVRGPGRVVETEKAHVDAPLGEGRQERE